MMKRAIAIAVLAVLGGAGGVYAVRRFSAQSVLAQAEVSERTAQVFQAKVDAIKKAASAPDRTSSELVEVTEADLESYILHVLKKDIPAQVDSFDVQLTDGAIAADTRMTFGATPTSNPLVDVLISGTHRLFLKGQLSAVGGMGRFTLVEARVDGIPVPVVLIETLIDKYVKPRYPQVKLNEPFTVPWGIDELTISSGRARILY
jgi:hypothetical protein